MNDTRLFFVTDSEEDNEELHETLNEAKDYITEMSPAVTPRIRICMVRNAFKEDSGGWNYDDQSDTFDEVKVLFNKQGVYND